MRIVVLTYRPPFPPVSGDRLRMFQLLEYLAPRHDVQLLSFARDPVQVRQALSLKGLGIEVSVVPLRSAVAKLRALAAVASPVPLQVAYYRDKAMAALVAATLKARPADVLYVHLARMASYLAPSLPCIQILDYMDAFSRFYRSRAAVAANPISGTVDEWESKRLAALEKQLAISADATVVVSDLDGQCISRDRPPVTVPLHVDDWLAWRGPAADLAAPAVMFFGEMSTRYSETAADYLSQQVMPQVWRRHPGARLYLVGANPTRAVKKLHGQGIIVTGYVEDVRPYVAGACATVAPIRMGSGLQMKVVQSMALGVPVVATSLANQGVGAQDGKHLLLADEPLSFAKAACRLIDDGELRTRLSREAMEFVQARFSGVAVFRALESALQLGAERRLARLAVASS